MDCNFGDGVDILAQLLPNPGPSLPADDGLHIYPLAGTVLRDHGWRWFLKVPIIVLCSCFYPRHQS